MTQQSTPQVAQAAISSSLPSRIAWFERLLYAAAVVSVIRLAIDQPKGIDIGALAAWYVLLIIQLSLIWLAARRRKMWACWVLLGFFLTWVLFNILRDAVDLQSAGWVPPNPVSVGLRFGQMVIEGIGLILVFSRRGRRWFNPNVGHRRDWNGV